MHFVLTLLLFSSFLGSLQPILLDTCENGTLRNGSATEMWLSKPKIPKILPYCTFKFCARVSEPYINTGCKSGLEVKIIRVLQERIEFKVKSTKCCK